MDAAQIEAELRNLKLAAGYLVDNVTEDGVQQLAFVLDRIDHILALVSQPTD